MTDDLALTLTPLTDADGTLVVDPHGPSLFFVAPRGANTWTEARVDRQQGTSLRLRQLRATRSALRRFIMATFDGWRCQSDRLGIPIEAHSIVSGLAHQASLSQDPARGLILASPSAGFCRFTNMARHDCHWVSDPGAASRFSVSEAAGLILPTLDQDDLVFQTADPAAR